MLHRKLPGTFGEPLESERDAIDELGYAGELMVVQFFSLFRGLFTKK